MYAGMNIHDARHQHKRCLENDILAHTYIIYNPFICHWQIMEENVVRYFWIIIM